MPDIDSMISTQGIMCIKRYLDPYTAGWKFFLDSYLKKVGGKFSICFIAILTLKGSR